MFKDHFSIKTFTLFSRNIQFNTYNSEDRDHLFIKTTSATWTRSSYTGWTGPTQLLNIEVIQLYRKQHLMISLLENTDKEVNNVVSIYEMS